MLDWSISIIAIALLCFIGYLFMKKSQRIHSEYFVLLNELDGHSPSDEMRAKIYTAGRRYYRNRLSGIDASIEIDIEQALNGERFGEKIDG